jgi:transcriptional regulator with XRE-family HTH domain
MARRDPEKDPRARLGDELRRARIAAGYSSQEALAAKLGFDRTVIAKAETGDRPPTPDVLAAWCQACHIDAEMFERWAVLARRADGPVPTWFEDWLKAEGEAHTLRIWQPLIIPGLLQIAEYARALFLAAGADEPKADELVAVRLERQSILDRADPPHLITVLDEGVLHKLIGSPAIMCGRVCGRYGPCFSMRPSKGVAPLPVCMLPNAHSEWVPGIQERPARDTRAFPPGEAWPPGSAAVTQCPAV